MGLFDELNKAVVSQQQLLNYNDLLSKAGVSIPDLKVADEGGTLKISGTVTDMQQAEKAIAALKAAAPGKEIENLLQAEDLTSKSIKMQVMTKESNLNIRRGPGTKFEVVGKAPHLSIVQLIKRMYNDWYFVRTEAGVEGFCAKDFLREI